MENGSANPAITGWIPVMVIGMMLNTLGIVLASLGPVRFAMMAVGLGMLLLALVKMLAARSVTRGRGEG